MDTSRRQDGTRAIRRSDDLTERIVKARHLTSDSCWRGHHPEVARPARPDHVDSQQNREPLDSSPNPKGGRRLNWDALAALAETVGALGVIATLSYLAVQVRQNTRAIRAQTYDSVVAQFRDWNQPMRADPEMAEQFHRMIEDVESLSAGDQQHAIHVFFDFFRVADNLHYQYLHGMLAESDWRGWERMFRAYLTAPGLVWYWQRRTSFFSSEFNEWMEKLQATSELADPRATAITKLGSEPAAV